jgi:hypothetical protein
VSFDSTFHELQAKMVQFSTFFYSSLRSFSWANEYDFATIVCELELGLIQTQMAQKPMLRAEVYARALRASKNVPLCLSTDIFVLVESY